MTGWDAYLAKLSGIPHVPQITGRCHVERSKLIAEAYASSMTTAQVEQFVNRLYAEEFSNVG